MFASSARSRLGKSVRQATSISSSISMKGGTCSTLLDLGGLLADLKDALASNVDLVEARCLHPYIRDRVPAEALLLFRALSQSA